jgi:nucleotide-binding universal stress UspA family protein
MIDLGVETVPDVAQADVDDSLDLSIGAPVIVATDGDPDANGAIRVAQLLSARDGTPVHAIAVLEPPLAYLLTLEHLPEEAQAARIGALRKRVERQLQRVDVSEDNWDIRIVVGRPADAIADLSIQTQAGLVLVGIGSQGALGRVWRGDTAMRAVYRTRRPVMAVHRDARALPRCAIVGIDFGPASIAAAQAAFRTMARRGIVHLVHVQPLFTLLAEGNSAINPAYGQELADQFDAVIQAMTAPPDIRVLHEIASGDPARCLLEIAGREGADLIAVGTHGYGRLQAAVLGSVASRVMRGAKCSVLIAPEIRARITMTGGPGQGRTVVSTVPSEWVGMLTDFTQRNAERPTMLEIDDPAIGAQAEERGYHLRGVTYDHRDGRVQLMLGGRTTGPHITHTVSGVNEVGIATGPDGRDSALRIAAGHSATILTFLA